MLEFSLPAPSPRALVFEARVRSILPLPEGVRAIEVGVNGKRVTEWQFTRESASGLRNAPASQFKLEAGVATLNVVFVPRRVITPVECDPSSSDLRQLGLGLEQFRVIESDKGI
jgi:hypothetical protein